MRTEFSSVIREALEAVNYADENDNDRFRAAVQDLANDFPDERKIFQRNADDRFLQICSFAGKSESDQIEAQKNQAAQYISGEYWVQEDLAKEFAEIVIDGFLGRVGEKNQSDQHETEIKIDDEDTNPVTDNSVDEEIIHDERAVESDNQKAEELKVTRHAGLGKKKRPVLVIALIGILICMAFAGKHQQKASIQEKENKQETNEEPERTYKQETDEDLYRTYSLPGAKKPRIQKPVGVIDLGVGGQKQLRVKYVHKGDKVTWRSSNPSIVSVNSKGRIKAKALGDATITAKVENYELELNCPVSVNKLYIRGDGIYLDGITEGEKKTIHVEGTDTKKIKWSSSDSNILSIKKRKNGKARIKAKRCGIATITARVDRQKVSITPDMWLSEKNVIRVSQNAITVADKSRIVVTCDVPSNIWSRYNNRDIAVTEWSRDWIGDNTYLIIKKTGYGTTTVTLWAGDKNGDRDYSIDSKTITVRCE